MATVTPGIQFISGETVTPAKLNAAASPTVAVANNEITTAKILDGAVTTAKIANENVTTAKIANENVTTAKIADDSVTTAKIVDNAVNNAKLSLAANDGEIKKALNADNVAPIYACRAWANFNGLAAVTDNLSGSYSASGALVQITILNHGLISGNIVRLTFSGTSPVPAAGTYTVISVVSADVFRITNSNPDSGSSGSTTWLRRLIRASGNVSSVTNTATAGKHIVNFAVPMPTSDYAISLGANTGSPVIGTATEQATQQAFYIIGANNAEVTTAVFA
jgi:hypothetical protein